LLVAGTTQARQHTKTNAKAKPDTEIPSDPEAQKPHYVNGEHNEEFHEAENENENQEPVQERVKAKPKETKAPVDKNMLKQHKADLDSSEKQAARAVIESCSGWRLNKLPKIKSFLNNKAKLYDNLEVSYTKGDPRIHFYGADGKIFETRNIAAMDENKIHDMLTSYGIMLKPGQPEPEQSPAPPPNKAERRLQEMQK